MSGSRACLVIFILRWCGGRGYRMNRNTYTNVQKYALIFQLHKPDPLFCIFLKGRPGQARMPAAGSAPREAADFNVFNFLQHSGRAFLLKNTIAASWLRPAGRPRLLGFLTRIRTFGTRSNAFLRASNGFRRKALLRMPEPPAGAAQTRGGPVKAAPLLTQRYNILSPKANSVKKVRAGHSGAPPRSSTTGKGRGKAALSAKNTESLSRRHGTLTDFV